MGVVAVIGSWFVYDGLCRLLRERPGLLAALVFAWFSLLAIVLGETLSGRAAYIHVGAAIGTVMVANVFFVIIPAQKEMVSALAENRPLDPAYGSNGLLRSRHNNYLTLPVLFTMISSHFPSTYGNSMAWLVLILLALVSVAVRHFFNVRHLGNRLAWVLPVAFAGMLGIMWMTAPEPVAGGAEVSDSEMTAIMVSRCVSCHAAVPSQAGFSAAPKGIELDSLEKIATHREAINQVTVLTRTMPLGNLTGMLAEERQVVGTLDSAAVLPMTAEYPRDMAGYGSHPPDPRWPERARVAVQFVVNYEEGGENNVLHGDIASEAFLSEIVGAQAYAGVRHASMESIYEFGSRAGFLAPAPAVHVTRHSGDGLRRGHGARAQP